MGRTVLFEMLATPLALSPKTTSEPDALTLPLAETLNMPELYFVPDPKVRELPLRIDVLTVPLKA